MAIGGSAFFFAGFEISYARRFSQNKVKKITKNCERMVIGKENPIFWLFLEPIYIWRFVEMKYTKIHAKSSLRGDWVSRHELSAYI